MRHHQSRRGFTLVELLVAAALTMLIMAILASSFQTAMDGMSHLRAAAEMQDRLRSASERLRTDLVTPHFDDEAIRNGKVSNLRFDLGVNTLPAGGYFHVIQAVPSLPENRLGVQLPNDYSSISTSHALAFTARLPGKDAQNLFTAPRPAGTLDHSNDNLVSDPASTYGTKWAIVSWFPVASDSTTGPNPRAVNTLHRRVKLLAETPNSFVLPALVPEASNYYVIDNRPQIQLLISTNPTIQYAAPVVNPNYGRILTVKDLAVRGPAPVLVGTNLYVSGAPAPEIPPLNVRTLTTGTTTTASVTAVLTGTMQPDFILPVGNGSDIVVSNVLSFEVKADYSTVVVTDNPVTNVVSATVNTPTVPANPQNPTAPPGLGYPTLYPRPAMAPNDSLTFLVPDLTQPNNKFYHPFANPDFPFDDLPRPYLPSIAGSLPTGVLPANTNLQTSFDTGSSPNYRVKALQIKMRIYDPKTQTTRQVTIVQEM